MLGNTKAYSGFAADDLQRARDFYENTLGLEVSGEGGDLITLHLTVYAKPDFTPATYTILNFPVDDIDAAVGELTARGVRFERYDGIEQDERGISRGDLGPQIAWCTDPAGNILSVIEER